MLTSLHMLPVYRTSEGVENLDQNYATFESCRGIFKTKGIVLIFSEGRCVNEWHLRPMKKGTARLALSSWAEGIPLQVVPLGLNYHSFRDFGKNADLNFGDTFNEKDINTLEGHGKSILAFNEKLTRELNPLVYEIESGDENKRKVLFDEPVSNLTRIVLAIPAAIGFITGLPLYYFVHRFAWKNHRKNDHFDSIIMSLLFFAYPLYVLLLSLFLFFSIGNLAWILLAVLPICAGCYTRFKKAF